MHFDHPIFLLVFLPALFAVYYSVIAAEGVYPRVAVFGAKGAAVVLLAGSVWLLAQSPVGWLLLGSAFVTTLLAATGEQLRNTHESICNRWLGQRNRGDGIAPRAAHGMARRDGCSRAAPSIGPDD